jgi:starch-binding outer membrane protein, SusD/RagB family
MKKLFKISILFLAILISGCSKDFDPVLNGVLSPADFPKTETDFELYTLQAYKPFGSKWGYNDVAYQNMFFSPEYGHLVMFDLPSDEFNISTQWGGAWEGFSKADFTFISTQGKASHFEKVRYVTRMTKVIDDIEKSSIPAAKKALFTAEARMGRGWAMYYLLHMYGPVPVIIDPAKINTSAESDLTRPTRDFFVKSIEEDLRFAADNLVKTPAQYGRFNKGIALGVLMRLYLNEKNYAKAEPVGREIVALGYSLVTDYASLFKEATEKNTETIFAVSVDPVAPTNGDGGGNFNAMALYCLPSDFKSIKLNGGWGSPIGIFCPTWQFYDSFDPSDKRRELMIPSYTAKDGVTLRNRTNMMGPVLRKYPDESTPGADVQGNDFPILRYGDVLLMLAEAINHNNNGPTLEAIGLVNEIRAKHGGLSGLPPSATGSMLAFDNAILNERGWDLYFEGVRTVDLVRHGKWKSALEGVGKIPGPSHLFPVPRYAIDVSAGKLTPTPGY